jgi:phage terminase large subunit GpA-like protein
VRSIATFAERAVRHRGQSTEGKPATYYLLPKNVDARELLNSVIKGFAPPERLSVSTWADKYRKLSPEDSAEPGQWRTDRAEYQRGMMDAISDPTVEMVVIMSSSQIGKSSIVNNAIAYYIAIDPCPILLIQPTVETAEDYSKDRIAPMIRDTPVLSGLVSDVKSKGSGNTRLCPRCSYGCC